MDAPTTIKNLPTAEFSESEFDAQYGGKIILADPKMPEYFMANPYFAGFDDLEDSNRKAFLATFIGLPVSLKNYLTSPETAFLINDIGVENDFVYSDISKIAETVRELLIGKIFIKDFPSVLASKLAVDEPKASQIVDKLVSGSFAPIIEDLKRIQRSKFPDKIMQLQKESRPGDNTQTTLGQASAKPAIPRTSLTPAQSVKETQNKQESAPQTPPPPPLAGKPPVQANPPIQPPQTKPPLQSPAIIPSPSVAPLQQPVSVPKPPVLDIKPPSPAQLPPKSTDLPKPQFKIPDLGQPVSKEDGIKINEDAQQSLEDELKRVANIIDLRGNENSKSNN